MSNIPKQAICLFKDGNQWCCVNADFINVQESPVGFGVGILEAINDLNKNIGEEIERLNH